MHGHTFPSCTRRRIILSLFSTVALYLMTDFLIIFNEMNQKYNQNNIQNLNHLDFSMKDNKPSKTVTHSMDVGNEKKTIKKYGYQNVNETHPCNITVVVFDPRLTNTGFFRSKNSLFTSIESVATHLTPQEGICFSIQTSACTIPNNVGSDEDDDNSPEAKAYKAILSNTRQNQYPHFHKYLQESGRVRISIIDTDKYSLKSCNNFMSPNYAWMNIHYWEDEFTKGVDSDLLFFIQDDSVLCEHIDIRRWNDIAYVGAPWPDVHHSVPKPTMCTFLKTKFYSWMKKNALSEQQQEIEFCPKEKGIFGNGGLSIRSLSWIKKAIRTCPHVTYSGLTTEELSKTDCSLDEAVPEDVYFSAILRYLNAPLPTAFEASLFSSEMIVPYQVAYEWWPLNNETEIKRLAKKRLTDDHFQKFEIYLNNEAHRHNKRFIPIGFHNTWFYHDKSFLDYVTSQCPAFNIIRHS